ncbi:hypothetical protein CHUAL_009980 [Chamberlinius hualienensis]
MKFFVVSAVFLVLIQICQSQKTDDKISGLFSGFLSQLNALRSTLQDLCGGYGDINTTQTNSANLGGSNYLGVICSYIKRN